MLNTAPSGTLSRLPQGGLALLPVLAAAGCATAYVIWLLEVKGAVIILAGVVGIPFFLYAITNPVRGIAITLALSFVLLGVKRLIGSIPLGLVMDALILGLFISVLFQKKVPGSLNSLKNPISVMMGIWIFYTLLEALNPVAESRAAWSYTIRSMAGQMILYFIVVLSLRTKKDVKMLSIIWIGMATAAAVYGLYQEYVGFQNFELAWIYQTQERFALLFQMGRFRKFSFFSDPMVFGFVMAYSALFCFTFMAAPVSKLSRMLLAVAGVMMLMGMLYSGTRAAYVLLPAGLFFYTVITLKKNIIITALVGLMAMGVLIKIPTSNVNLIRFQSAFQPSEDASYKTRKRNQARIQPFIQQNPMGGGMGSTGVWGQRFSPNSFLANFPPDSGYVRIAVEMGWVGLLLYCTLMFCILITGVRNYLSIQDPLLKAYCAGVLCVLYCLVVANFPQEAITQLPTSMLFYILTAILGRLKDFDTLPAAPHTPLA